METNDTHQVLTWRETYLPSKEDRENYDKVFFHIQKTFKHDKFHRSIDGIGISYFGANEMAVRFRYFTFGALSLLEDEDCI